MHKPKTLTRPQIAAYWRALQAATANLGIFDRADVDAYRKQIMKEECNVDSLKKLNRTGDFDKVMARFAEDAGDYQRATQFAVGDDRRLAVLVRICCEQIMQLTGKPAGSTAARDYIAGIIRRSHILCGDPTDPGYWVDLGRDSLQAVFSMLDTHRRRLLRRAGLRTPGGFDPSLVYTPTQIGVTIICNAAYYERVCGIRQAAS